MKDDIVKRADGLAWTLVTEPTRVVRCLVDYGFSIQVDNGVEVRIDTAFHYTSPDGTAHHLDPELAAPLLGPALAAARREVVEAEAFTDGTLKMRFDDDSSLTVPFHEDFEAWNVTGPRGLLLVAMPGGSLAEWSQAPDDTPRSKGFEAPGF